VKKLNYRFCAILLAAVGLGACGQSQESPKGQVVARVGGQEITLSELNAEILASNLAGKADDKKMTEKVLDRLVARKLLVQAAREEGLDKSSEFIVARQRSEENDLAGLAQRQLISQVKRPTKQEAEQYVKTHPQIFNGRKLMILEQIRFPQPANANDVKFLEGAKSLDQVAEMLKQNAIKFDRGPTVLDTTSVGQELSNRIDKLPPGEVFVISNGKLVLVNVITEKRPAAIPPEAALQYAARLIQQERGQAAIENQLKELRKKATITYQPGYGPAKPAKPGA